jgi:four helix bundle protein
MGFKRGYTELLAWQKAMDFIDAIYSATRNFPKEELYGLCSQLRRSAVSIAANLAEGCSRTSTKEFIRFVEIALGSLAETETHLMIAHRQKYLNAELLNVSLEQGAEIGRMMQGLRNSLEKRLQSDLTNRQPLTASN